MFRHPRSSCSPPAPLSADVVVPVDGPDPSRSSPAIPSLRGLRSGGTRLDAGDRRRPAFPTSPCRKFTRRRGTRSIRRFAFSELQHAERFGIDRHFVPRIANLDVAVPVLLAPMAAVTDLPFRTVCERSAASVSRSPSSLSAHAPRPRAPRRPSTSSPKPRQAALRRADLHGRRLGRDAARRRDGGRHRHSLVDINMGCPTTGVVAGECGSALMRDGLQRRELVPRGQRSVPADVLTGDRQASHGAGRSLQEWRRVVVLAPASRPAPR